MAERALVLGGGGPVGIAWEIGLAAGLAEKGIEIAVADRIVGTSAGSFVGASLASGRTPESLLRAQVEQGARDAAARSGAPAGERPKAPDLTPLMRLMMRRPAEGEPPRELLVEIGAFALEAKTMPEENFVGSFGSLVREGGAWPRGFVCTAVDALTGEFVAWEEKSNVPLGRAIASSCSVPGIFPPITINDRRYVDGGMRSATNVDLAAGHRRVLVVAVLSRATTEPMRARLTQEIEALKKTGSEVELVTPNAECLEVFGANLMDAARRGDVAEAGHRQGRAEAERLRGFWK